MHIGSFVIGKSETNDLAWLSKTGSLPFDNFEFFIRIGNHMISSAIWNK